MPEEGGQTDFSEFEAVDDTKTFLDKAKRILLSFLNTLPTYPKRYYIFGVLTILLLIGGASISSVKKQTGNKEVVATPPPNTKSLSASQVSPSKKEVIGFFPSWMVANKAEVNPSRLTQLIYFGLGVNEKGELIQFNQEGNPVLEWTYFNSDYFQKVKDEAQAGGTKVLVAIKSFDNATIDNLISNQAATDRLAKGLINLIKEHDLDGVNIDFEYVTDTDFPTGRFLNRFLETLTLALHRQNPALIVSFDVNANAVLTDRAYDLVKIGQIVDQVILMAYDYHRASSSRAGPVAPLSAPKNENSIKKSLNSLQGRVPFDKVILGIPFYGYEWQTVSAGNRAETVANSGALATYKRVRELIASRSDVRFHWDDLAQSPWLTYRQSGAIKQIYYEDKRSVAAKLDFAEEQRLAGIAIWALGYEGYGEDLWQPIKQHSN